jgi:WD40 repeat protein
VAFCLDGRLLATGSSDWTVILWDLGISLDPAETATLAHRSGGRRWRSARRPAVATGSHDRTVIVWAGSC